MDETKPENPQASPAQCPRCGEMTFAGNGRTTKGAPIAYVMCLNVACDWADSEPAAEAK